MAPVSLPVAEYQPHQHGARSLSGWLPRLGIRHALLAAILLGYAYLGVGYARATPRWNNPDEPAHFNYVRHVAQTGQLPILQPGDWDAELLGRLTTRWFPTDDLAAIRYEGHQPPLYYLLGATVHRLTWDLPLDRQVLALKGLSILLGAVAVLAAYVVGREAAPDHPELALLASALVAFVPMHGAISAAINNDSLANALAGVILAALMIGRRRGFGVRGAVALGVLLGLALLTKLTLYVYVPLALAVLWIHRDGRAGSATALRRAVLAGGVALLLAAPWLLRNVAVYGLGDPLGLVRHDAVVVGQPRWVTFVPPADLHPLDYFARTLFRSFWGVFGWMGVILDDGFYALYLVLTGLGLAGLVLTRFYREGRSGGVAPANRGPSARDGHDPEATIPTLTLNGGGLLAASILFVFGQVAYYNLTFVQPQGRYLFPALVPIAVFLAMGWWRLAQTAGSGSRLGAVPAALLVAALAWSFAEWHGAARARELWSDEALIATATVAGLAVLAVPRRRRSALPLVLVGLCGLALALLDYAALVRFVAPAFPAR